MKHRSAGIMVLAFSIGLGLLAALLSIRFLSSMAEETVVLVPTEDIQAFTALSESMVATKKMPRKQLPSDALTEADLAKVQGQFSRMTLLQGTILRQAHLATSDHKSSTLAAKLTETKLPGTRALAISVDNSTGVGGTIEPGDKVDIIAAVKVDNPKGPATSMATTIAQSIPVLHRTEAEGSAKRSIVVQVTPEQAEEIAYAQLIGTIYLATNPYDADPEAIKTSGMTAETFLERHSGR